MGMFDLRDLLLKLAKDRYVVEPTSNGKRFNIYVIQNGQKQFVCQIRDTKDPHGLRNAISELRKSGFIWRK